MCICTCLNETGASSIRHNADCNRFFAARLRGRDMKNIVLLSDGTGNSAAKLFKTNVWGLYQALDLADETRQIAYYDDGVGTSSFKPLALLGGAAGWGLKRNVLDLYTY